MDKQLPLFRGKRIEDGDWVFGCYGYSTRDNFHYITNPMADSENAWAFTYEVDPATVSQFTGLIDINGTKIFRDDIIQKDVYKETRRVVEYKHFGFWITMLFGNGNYPVTFEGLTGQNGNEWTVIGNIHDNKDLLKK